MCDLDLSRIVRHRSFHTRKENVSLEIIDLNFILLVN